MNAAIQAAPDDRVVAIEGLSKHFGKVCALNGVDLDVARGHIVGLVGPNSAGKSTLLRHIAGIYLPTHGSCRVFGIEAARLSERELARIGYVHQEGQLLDWLSTGNLIRYVAAHYATWNDELERSLAELFELDRSARVGRLSPGQRQKLGLLLAVCYEPELLLLDEPASALDPIARRRFLELLLSLIQDQQRTVLISSHILGDIEKVIDHVVIMDHGRILRDVAFDDLLEEYVKLELRAVDGCLPERLSVPGALSIERDDRQAIVIARRAGFDWPSLAQTLGCHVDTRRLTLEEIYPIVLDEHSPDPVARYRLSAGVS